MSLWLPEKQSGQSKPAVASSAGLEEAVEAKPAISTAGIIAIVSRRAYLP